MDAELFLEAPLSAAAQRDLQTHLSALPGIEQLRITAGVIILRYDPEFTTKAQLCESITHAGFAISSVENVSASPMVDALHEHDAHPP